MLDKFCHNCKLRAKNTENNLIKIKPFRGLRPKKDLYPEVIAPPYDVVNYDDCVRLGKNPLSLIHITRSEIDLNAKDNPYSKEVYLKSKENLEDFIKKGYLVFDEKPCFYIYRQIMNGHKQTGFVGINSVYDYEKGIIKKHENTRKDKEEDRINHIDITDCQVEPVFLAYKNEPGLDGILSDFDNKNPDIDLTTNDGVRHSLWIIKDDGLIGSIIKGFEKTDCLYVADGHHRTAAALSVAKKRDVESVNKNEKEYGFFLSVIFPRDSLKIMPYNRAVKDLNGNTKDAFLEKVGKCFDILPVKPNDGTGFKPGNPKQFGMYLDKEWCLLTLKPAYFIDDPVKSLDVSILQNNILEPVLGIKDPRTDKRIEFIGGIKGTEILKEIVDNRNFQVSFSMYPTSMEELLNVADSNNLMPPKSTWFEPKLGSGVVLHYLGDYKNFL
jgi:uncharacterized protein (DUF1015 family)